MGHAEDSWAILSVQNVFPTMLFHAFWVESKKQFELQQYRNICSCTTHIPVFQSLTGSCRPSIISFKRIADSWLIWMAYSRESCFMTVKSSKPRKYWLKLKRDFWCRARSCLSKRFVGDKTIFIPPCCQHVQAHAGGGEKLNSSACFAFIPSQLSGRVPRGFLACCHRAGALLQLSL